MTNRLFQRLPCGCEPDRGRSCDRHTFERQVEARLLWRYLRGDGEYRDFKRVHDTRLAHYREQANGK